MDPVFIIAQILGIAAWLFFLIGYTAKRLNRVILYHFISSVLYSLNYLLLGAWSGLFISVFEGILGLSYMLTDKDKYIFYGTLPVYAIILLISDKTPLMFVPIVASILDGYAATRNRNMTITCGTISLILWIVYDLYYGDYTVALTDVFVVLFNITILAFGYSKYLHRNNVYAMAYHSVATSTLKTVSSLDQQYYGATVCWDLPKLTEVYGAEKDSYILVKDRHKIVGYVNILSLKKEAFDAINESDVMKDDFAKDDIVRYTKNRKHYYLNIESIVLKNEYQNRDSVVKLAHAIKRFCARKARRGYIIDGINAYAVNELEAKVLKEFGLTPTKRITNECVLYQKLALAENTNK